jgi:hypothetical protein
VWPKRSDALLSVKPETVIDWHRADFRKYWTWLLATPMQGAAFGQLGVYAN